MQWKLIRLRKEAGLTQKELAEFIGMKSDTYRRKESGENSFLDYEMFKIRDFFNNRNSQEYQVDDIFLPKKYIENVL